MQQINQTNRNRVYRASARTYIKKKSVVWSTEGNLDEAESWHKMRTAR
ncbi:MAG: hypothetical protein H6661_08635 [Ardenticatenaceae bacterium]|nr:hypothetical protein [Ardenticatenaceae bacterium]